VVKGDEVSFCLCRLMQRRVHSHGVTLEHPNHRRASTSMATGSRIMVALLLWGQTRERSLKVRLVSLSHDKCDDIKLTVEPVGKNLKKMVL
jgi:hypothetical protein